MFASGTIAFQRMTTFLLSTVGTGLFWIGNIPLPFLFGPMFACLVAALLGVRMKGYGQLSVAARTILGVAAGAAFTPAVFAVLPSMIASVLLIPVFILVIGAVGYPFFRRVWGFDPATAYYSAMPGGLQDMVIFGQEAGGDVRSLSLIHATRVLIIVTVAPVLLVHLYDAELSNPIGAPARDVPMLEIVLMIAAAGIGWKGGERLGLFGASILGPMILTAALSLANIIHVRPPAEAILFAQFMIGSAIGVHFVGITLSELRRTVLSGVAYVAVLAVLAAVFSQLVAGLGLGAPTEAFLAFAPGGQAEMVILAIVAGADLGYVVTHHLIRIIVVIVGAPIAAKVVKPVTVSSDNQ